MADNVEKFPEQKKPAHEADPVKAFSRMRDELAASAAAVAFHLSATNPKTAPTTYQTYRWLGGAFVECQKKIDELVKVAGIKLSEPSDIAVIFLQIPVLLADIEPRSYAAVQVFDLDKLPPGNPREPKFEAALKTKIAINKAYAVLQQNLGALAAALASDTYKMGITEEERAVAWRAKRKQQLTETLLNTEKQLSEAEGFVKRLNEIKADLLNKLVENDQMKFEEIDPSKPVQLGDEE